MENATLATGKKYIKDIFSPGQFYNVPEYQRPYVWGEDQIIALLEDISRALDGDENKEYFVGCMIWNTRKHKDQDNVEYEYQDILDGQQRFITLFLLHGVIRDFSDNDQLKQNVRKRLVQEADVYSNIPARNRIQFEIREDKEFLDDYIIRQGGTDFVSDLEQAKQNNKLTASVRNMADGILCIRQWWRSKLNEQEDGVQQYLESFYKYLSNKVLALYLATPNNLDDAYNLFTVLNSRGLQLQVSDILRAQNLRVIDNDVIRKSYAVKWSDFENSITAPYKSFDDFLWALVFVRMKYRSDDNKSLTKAFDFMFKRGMLNKGHETLDFVGKYVDHFQAITNGSITSKESQYLFGNLNLILASVFGSQYITPLMHYRECFGESGIISFLIKIDNLLSMGWLIGRRQSQTRIFLILRKMDQYSELVKSGEASLSQAAEDFLRDPCLSYDYFDEEVSSEKPINLNEFYEVLHSSRWGSFAGTRVNKTRYLLLKLDLLMGNLGTVIQYNKDSSSIEHLMPQNIAGTEWDIAEDEHKEWVHRLGNLALIDRNKNASLSNKLFKEKKEKYHGAIETRANTNFILIENQDWSIEAIKRNHERSISVLMSYYEGNNLNTLIELKKKNHISQARILL